MMRKVDYSFLVGCRRIGNLQFVLVGQRVNHVNCQVARISLLAISAEIGQFETYLIGTLHRFCSPYDAVVSVNAAMLMVRSVVRCLLVILAPLRKLSVNHI